MRALTSYVTLEDAIRAGERGACRPVNSPLRSLLVLAGTLACGASAAAQSYSPERARPQFVTLSYDWMYTQPLHFAEHPIEDLLGADVREAQREAFEYVTADGATRVDVLQFRRRGNGFGVTVYPFGLRAGSTLGVRGSIEQIPTIRVAFDGPARIGAYALTNALAYDIGAGLYVADRGTGWSLGSYAFVTGGLGRIQSDIGDGSRYFAEGGGGVSSGPLGVQLSVKFAWNRLHEPVAHRFLTIPITLRGTLSF